MVNPLFAVPVACVIVFALLVFVFSIRSPVQPPRFDFEDDEKKQKRIKKTRKPTTNGHIPESSPEPEPAKQQVAAKQQSPKPSPAVAKQQQNKIKAKKASVTKAPAEEAPQAQEDDGEWTTQVSRKKKSKGNKTEGVKSKPDEKVLGDEESGDQEGETPAPTQEGKAPAPTQVGKDPTVKTTAPVESPKGQRAKKEGKSPKKSQKDSVKPDESVSVPQPPLASDTSSPDQTAETQVVEKPMDSKLSTETKASPSKKSKKERSISPPKEQESSPTPLATGTPNPPEPKIEGSTSPKSPQSPSKKKKEKSPAPAEPDPSASTPDQDTSGANKQTSDKGASDAVDNGTAPEAKGALNFDELGDEWEEAKPQKKKKKARREN